MALVRVTVGRRMMPADAERAVRKRLRVVCGPLSGKVRAQASRRELPRMMQAFGYRRGAEIGVWKGAYSASFCEANPDLHMLCVDPWASYQGWLDTKNSMPRDRAEAFIEQAYREAVTRLAGLNVTISRKFSADAALEVPDASLDFVYIDGNHVLEAVTEDLTLWSAKVRPGGIVAGHDYRLFTNKPTIHVVPAVNAFTARHRISPWYVLVGDRTPSFLWVKH